MVSFDEEWAELQAAAREELATRTRLNSLTDGGTGSAGPGQGDLVADDEAIRGVADVIEQELEPVVVQAGHHHVVSTSQVMVALRSWHTASGLSTWAEAWGRKTRALRERLLDEAQALRGTADGYTFTEEENRDNLNATTAIVPFNPSITEM